MIRFFLCAIDLFSTYAWVLPLEDRKGIIIVNAFQKNLHDLKTIANKIWLYQGSEFHNSQFKKYLKDNDIKMY